MAKNKNQETSKVTSLASLWDDTDASEASNDLPEGTHTVRLNKLEFSEKEGKGSAVFVQYEALDGENDGMSVRQMYKLTDADNNKSQGMAILKRDLQLLGHEDISGKKLKKTLEEITEEQPLVIIRVAKSGQYLNAYLQGLADGAGSEGEESDADGEAEAAEIEVGSKVTWKEGKKSFSGEVKKIKGVTATVEDSDDAIHKVELDDLELEEEETEAEAEAEAEAKEIEVGSKVTFEDPEDSDNTLMGDVMKIKGDVATVDVDDHTDSPFKVELDDLTLVEEDGDDAPSFDEGDDVTFTDPDDDDEELEGKILKLKGEKATVRVGKKTYTVDLDDLKAND